MPKPGSGSSGQEYWPPPERRADTARVLALGAGWTAGIAAFVNNRAAALGRAECFRRTPCALVVKVTNVRPPTAKPPNAWHSRKCESVSNGPHLSIGKKCTCVNPRGLTPSTYTGMYAIYASPGGCPTDRLLSATPPCKDFLIQALQPNLWVNSGSGSSPRV